MRGQYPDKPVSSGLDSHSSPTFRVVQDLRTCGELSGFRRISRGLRPREIRQLRKSYGNFRIVVRPVPIQRLGETLGKFTGDVTGDPNSQLQNRELIRTDVLAMNFLDFGRYLAGCARESSW
jgi:hypothetical protein